MNTTEEIIRLLRELTEELKHDNDAHDNSQKAETSTNDTKEEKENVR
jgi:hypothetical protein